MTRMIEVVTLGLGYIGLPTSALIANNSIRVLGVDVNDSVVEKVNKGEVHIIEPNLEVAISQAVGSGYLSASVKPTQGAVYLIVVPTPFKGKNEPDISYVESATDSIIPFLKKGDLYIIESTCPIGTTNKMLERILASRPELEGMIHVAYCPERVLPGNIMHELIHNDRVIGGVSQKSTEEATVFYARFVKGALWPTNAQTAEMCKLVENSSRDDQIAFANELSLICDKAGIDVWELIQLANRHPRVNILRPGSGVGGHCIAVDPYFIVSDYPIESKIIAKAREINNCKSLWCVEKIKSTELEFEIRNGRKAKVALLGLAFKPDIDDLRESPALYIVQEAISQSDANFYIVEPNIASHEAFDLTDFSEACIKSDILVFLVKHKEFTGIELRNDQLILDFCGAQIGKHHN